MLGIKFCKDTLGIEEEFVAMLGRKIPQRNERL
jgi:hypothetical protein